MSRRIQSLLTEYENECKSTRKLLERVPVDQQNWKPHAKSMSLGALAIHVAEIPEWMRATLEHPELDFAKVPYEPKKIASVEDLLKIHDDCVAEALNCLRNIDDAELDHTWTLRNGEQVYFTLPKPAVLRMFVYNHLYHHRGQLTVYLRMLDVPLPGMYGPTADEPGM